MLSRRSLLNLASIGSAATLLVSCGSRSSTVCADPDDLTDAELTLRTSMNYVEASPIADQQCRQCAFFEAADAGPCGTCSLLKGPVNSAGHCSSWSRATPSS